MELFIGKSVISQLIGAARAAHPHECCGILLGAGGRITEATPAANVHPSPETRFEIDPQALVDAHRAARHGGKPVIGYYHSHPSGPPQPSATDRAMAAGDGSVWAIIGHDSVMFWQDTPDGFQALSYEVFRA